MLFSSFSASLESLFSQTAYKVLFVSYSYFQLGTCAWKHVATIRHTLCHHEVFRANLHGRM